jgi:DNA-binding SARP family transcriptional activator
MTLDFHLLGPFGVKCGKETLRLGGRRQKAVLALLTIHVGDVVSTDRIAHEIWSGHPPQSAVQTIHTYISRLRKILQGSQFKDDQPEIIRRQDPGYILTVPRDAIDAHRFEETVAAASGHLTSGNPGDAAEELRRALNFWRGSPLADLDTEPFAAVESQRLDERRLEAIELLIEAELALAHHSRVVAELQDLVDRFPVRERFWAQLITALYRSGRQAEALAAYGRVRALLVEELGVEPGPELQQLELRVLEQSPDLDCNSATDEVPRIGSTTHFPLPSRLPHLPAIGMVGRSRERQRLTDAYETVNADESFRIVLIGGEAGVGKTTLVSSFAHAAWEQGAVVIYGRCDEDLLIPYGPFVEAFAHYVAQAGDSAIGELGRDHLSALARLLPALRERPGDLSDTKASDPDAERWLLYGGVVALMQSAASRTPVVVLLEDLHWADRPTLQLLRHISSHLSGRILLVGTYRDTELPFADPVAETLVTLNTQTAALGLDQQVVRLSLSGLEEDEVVSFLGASAGHEMDQMGLNLAHALHRETGGNPLFVAEVLRHLVETHSLVQEHTGRWVQTKDLSEVGLPESVRQVIQSRVRRLGEGAGRVLSTASVLGQEFEAELLASVIGSDEEVVLDVLEAASSAALTTEVSNAPGRYRFAHALIQHTLYEGLSATRRARLHRSIAEALEDRLGDHPGDRASELARHWLSAMRPTDRAKAVEYACVAGENALDALAPSEAIRWFNLALEVLAQVPDDRQRAGCLAGLGEAQRQTGDGSYRETLLEAGRLSEIIGDVDVLVRAALTNNRGWASTAGTVDLERIGVLKAALKALPTSDSVPRARLLALLAMERTYDGDYLARKALADEALSIARRLKDPAAVLDVLLRRRLAIRKVDTVEALLDESVEAMAIAERVGDPVASFWSAVSHAVFSVQVGDILAVTRCHEELARLASQVGQPILRWDAAWQRSWSALLVGDLEHAESLTNEALQIGNDTRQPDAFAIFGGQLFAIRWQQGRLGEIVEAIAQLADENPGLPAYRAAAAHALAEVDRSDEAAKLLDREKSTGFSVVDDYIVLTYLDEWARVASHVGDRAAAQVLYDRLAPWPNLVAFSGITVQGAVQHSLGTLSAVLGQFDAAEDHFKRAFRIHCKLGAPFFIAITQLEWGRMLLLRRAEGDSTTAKTMFHSARDLALHHGYGELERRSLTGLSTLEGSM